MQEPANTNVHPKNNAHGLNTSEVRHVEVTKQEPNEYLECLKNLSHGLYEADEALSKTRAVATFMLHRDLVKEWPRHYDGLLAELSYRLWEVAKALDRMGAASDWLLRNDSLHAVKRRKRIKRNQGGGATNLMGLGDRQTKTDEDPSVAG